MKLIAKYINGNYTVRVYDDGTKVRETIEEDATEFIPDFAENCDVKITDRCDGNCPYCYEGCSANGNHADLLSVTWIDSLHAGTELALNGNDLSNPELLDFLIKLRNKHVITNITVNQKHFMKFYDILKDWHEDKLIHGIGVSLIDATDEFIEIIKKFPTAVIHTINGILTEEQVNKLSNNNLKLLILGYKMRERGISYFNNEQYNSELKNNQAWLSSNLSDMLTKFNVVSFDNLAIEQLPVKSLMTETQWNEFYMGDDGNYTFYIDMVKNEFARNSVSDKRFPILPNMTIDDMFSIIRKGK